MKIIEKFIYNNFVFKKEKEFIFLYFESGLKKGSGISDLILALIDEYEKSLDESKYNIYTLEKLKLLNDNILYNGYSISDALYESGFINNKEKSILSYAKSLDQGLNYILKSEKKYDDIKWSILIFFLPSMVVSTGYLIFQPQLKQLVLEMIAPVNNLSTTPIKIPPEFQDRTIFLMLNIIVYGLCFLSFMFVYLLKAKFPQKYFKWLPLVDSEFILNYFTIINNQMKIGISLGQIISNISFNEKDPVVKRIFNELNRELYIGSVDFHKIFKKYGFDKATISYLKIGEKTQSFSESLDIIIDYHSKKHEKNVKILLKVLPLAGEITMAFILLIPIIDMIMVTTVGVLNFTV